MKLKPIFFSLVLMVAFWPSVLANTPQHHILYINSYHPGFSWSDEVTKGLLDYFKENDNFYVHTEFMDAKRFDPNVVESVFIPYLSNKYKATNIELVVTSDNSALDMVIKYQNISLFKNVPIVFAGISNPEDYPIEELNLYGVVEKNMFVASFDVMRKVYPNFRTVYLFVDRTNTGKIYRREAENLIRDYPEYKLVVKDSIFLESIDSTLAAITGNSMIYYQGVSTDGAGNLIDHYIVARHIFKYAQVPVFTSYALDVEGALGGQYIGGYEHGNLCAELAEKRIKGEVISNRLNSPPLSGIFDYSKLVQYNLDPSQLPKGVRFINKPEAGWERYRQIIITNMAIIAILVLVIVFLVWLNKTQNHAKHMMGKAMEKALETDKLKGAFLANVSHELRTPLNAICGFSELVKAENNDPMVDEYLTVIYDNSELLSQLVNDLLDISLIDANAVTIKTGNVDLEQVFATLKTQAQSIVKLKGKEHIAVNMCTNPAYRHVKTDAFRVSQVMLNLINNAAKYTDNGSITLGYDHASQVADWLDIQPPGDAHIVLYVKDTGIGIDTDKQPLVFDRFRRVDTMFVSQHGGVGLGLNISKSLVEMLGGKIFVSSKKGIGSVFGFFLPI